MQRLNKIFFLLLLLFPVLLFGETIYSGKVIDSYTKKPIYGAKVQLQGTNNVVFTDNSGTFSFNTGIDEPTSDFELSTIGNKIFWSASNPLSINIYSLLGQNTGHSWTSLVGSGEISLQDLASGIYLTRIGYNGGYYCSKLYVQPGSLLLSTIKSVEIETYDSVAATVDTLVITMEGYYTQKYGYKETSEQYEILQKSYNDIDYLNKIIRTESFTMMQGLPFNPSFGEVKSVKVVYSIRDGKIYYTNSEKYLIHYDFCYQVLNYLKGHAAFNQEEYTKNANRIYILANLNHFTSSDLYTLEFFAGDELDCSDIETVYNKVSETFLLNNPLYYYANTTTWATCTNVPQITSDELYNGQNYQPLNTGQNYGYLRNITATELNTTYLGRHDIVLLNSIPLDISVVAGIITTEFQTPLSHINVLSHNRGTPNMALRDGWTNPILTTLLGKLVYFKVTLDSFVIREASLSEAETYWAQKEPQTVHNLDLDTVTSGLVDLDTADVNSVSVVGGKAANFAELTRVSSTEYGSVPLPEGYFAIPFYYYWNHLKKYGIDKFVDSMLSNELFKTNVDWRKQQLTVLQDSIKHCPLDTGLIRLVTEKLQVSGYENFRFRSSTNSEDIDGFNGAGLYESFTGSLTNTDKPIDKAIKKVWASLWEYGAYEERDYFKIDHHTVAMGILVHRSFPAEEANGVVITKNLYNQYNSAITINVQVGEISVVNPEENYLPDQIIFYTYTDENVIEYINHSNVPGMEDKTVMTEDELRELRSFCMAIHYHYCTLNLECNPMDIEFKVDRVNGARKLYIKQARLY